jgi:hypothetical protein
MPNPRRRFCSLVQNARARPLQKPSSGGGRPPVFLAPRGTQEPCRKPEVSNVDANPRTNRPPPQPSSLRSDNQQSCASDYSSTGCPAKELGIPPQPSRGRNRQIFIRPCSGSATAEAVVAAGPRGPVQTNGGGPPRHRAASARPSGREPDSPCAWQSHSRGASRPACT